MEDRRGHLTRLARAAARHRRLLAAGLAAGAMALAIEAASRSAPSGIDVLVAAHDLDGGTTISQDDLTTTSFPPDAVPDSVLDLTEATGGTLAAPMRAGEPVTDQRLLGPSLLDGWGDHLVAAPVRVTETGAAALIRPGDRINVLAAPADGLNPPRVIAEDVPVLTVADDSTPAKGTVLVVGATAEQATELAHAAVTSRVSFTMGVPDT
ncbi:flagellar biosynthesis protein FlgA [Actinobacteria bacterium YIM 96077]|uniref:Flagellar biosynthesis protein FlgA n=1 Tax=Phytoactinopolyspora halophila TaxID=1981511 RepID=A0A329QVJ4_9ACTN|nr:SAF domain-containing protein [Phytoactinopolyspora halophila]AYY14874.1 flagellar biosynthesis protein FlgA [Actinobacteria bacterium YIM 96077]RAW15332.1 flagellar biosynthesis protein FlgA [Phytoactinopolyspora halophila]